MELRGVGSGVSGGHRLGSCRSWRFRRSSASGWRNESRQASNGTEGSGIREGVFRSGQTGRCHLSRAVDGNRNWLRQREEDCLVAVAQDRPAKCRGRVDQEVVVDGKLVSSRKPDDIPAFNREMLKLFSQVK